MSWTLENDNGFPFLSFIHWERAIRHNLGFQLVSDISQHHSVRKNKTYQFANSVKYKVHNFFANCVVTTSIVVGSILFPCDQLFWVEKLTICSCPDLIWKEGANISIYQWSYIMKLIQSTAGLISASELSILE